MEQAKKKILVPQKTVLRRRFLYKLKDSMQLMAEFLQHWNQGYQNPRDCLHKTYFLRKAKKCNQGKEEKNTKKKKKKSSPWVQDLAYHKTVIMLSFLNNVLKHD